MANEQQQIELLKSQVTKLQQENQQLKGSVATKGKIQCIIGNVDEFANEIDLLLPDADGDGKIDKIPFINGWTAIMQLTWNKIKETRLECYGKVTEVELPAGWVGGAIQFALSTIGLKL